MRNFFMGLLQVWLVIRPEYRRLISRRVKKRALTQRIKKKVIDVIYTRFRDLQGIVMSFPDQDWV